jgi:hypothetical protein
MTKEWTDKSQEHRGAGHYAMECKEVRQCASQKVGNKREGIEEVEIPCLMVKLS